MSQKTILIVDDSPQNIQILTSFLRGEFLVKAATNGEKALALVATPNHRPDLILLDVMMPGMDGYEVCRRIKEDPETADIPIIFVTARTQVEDEGKGFRYGAVDYVHKPFEAAIIDARIKTHLALREARLSAERAERRANELLEILLPRFAADEIRSTGTMIPRRFERTAVLFCDVVDFTAYCDSHEPEDVVARLNTLFVRFEELARRHGVEKIKTIGDAFMAAANLLSPHDDPIGAAILCGLELGAAVDDLCLGWACRFGVHAGPVVAGVVGQERYQFDIWGDTVNVAARMAGIGSPGSVTMTEEVWSATGDRFQAFSLGVRDIKGKGGTAVVEVRNQRSALPLTVHNE